MNVALNKKNKIKFNKKTNIKTPLNSQIPT